MLRLVAVLSRVLLLLLLPVLSLWATSIAPTILSMASESAVLTDDVDLPCPPKILEPLRDVDPFFPIPDPGEFFPALSGEFVCAEFVLSSIAFKRGGGLGSRKSNMPGVPLRDRPLLCLSSRLVREKRAHQESLRRMGFGAGSMMEDGRGERAS